MASHVRDSDPFATDDQSPYEQFYDQGYGRPADPYAGPAPAYDEPPLRRRRRVWPWVVLILLVAIIAVVGVTGFRLYSSAKQVKAEAQTAIGFAGSYIDAAKTGDSELLQQSARGVSTSAHSIKDELSTPLWGIAAHVPVYGSDVQSVQTLADVLVDVADNALMPLAQNSGVMNLSTLMQDSAVNVAALQELIAAINQAGPVITRSAETIEALPPAHLEQVSTALESVREKVVSASDTLEQISPLLPYLPELLGANGQTKTYLVLAQNNAEVHATGGFVGTVGHIIVTDGHISMGDFTGVWDALNGYAVSAGATQEEIDVFGERCDTHHGDHNYIPDFSRVGQLYHDVNNTINGEVVDGVVAFDPVFLQYMLGLVGGVDTSYGVTVDGTNAASIMLNKSLFWWEPAVCDDFYDDVAELAFTKILTGLGGVDTTQFMETLMRAADEGRCVIWFSDPGAEEAIQKAGFGWELGHDATKPVTGIYVNDATTAKLAYYLSVDPVVGESWTNEDGSTSYPMTVTITHHLDRSRLTTIPGYLISNTGQYYNTGVFMLYDDLHFIAPEGGRIENMQVVSSPEDAYPQNGGDFYDLRYQGLQDLKTNMHINAGETITLTYTVVTAPEASEPLKVRVTPLIPADIAYWNEQ